MGNLKGMGKVGFAGKTHLSLMDLGRIDIGLFHQADVRLGMIAKELCSDVI
jgi:hypothetical protein